ncbi:hypothetical protein [Actinoplanes friuliensis]|uniref:Uncharacterized protein n=1 Tax=Actinoplanes friuliensis DSM 7358 TaxID=1246995 RepID=U5VY73_9ACTN|nr:hypothetical protein [Actinoplanes friuliensis]AGZ41948.1 hypothetical protein AFR_18350 [Actinoplanes friuliensis DSM 7358]
MDGPIKTSTWFLEPYADHSAAFVFSREPFGVSVLDRLTWYVLELCDGRTPEGIRERVGALLGDRATGDQVGALVDRKLDLLRRHGLITAGAPR